MEHRINVARFRLVVIPSSQVINSNKEVRKGIMNAPMRVVIPSSQVINSNQKNNKNN
ncbi:MAG: hypothetical protein JG767_1610 [Deferribacteraceae bacterium]|nr:hypothetical protein [Deferribacteraceae bacterium]